MDMKHLLPLFLVIFALAAASCRSSGSSDATTAEEEVQEASVPVAEPLREEDSFTSETIPDAVLRRMLGHSLPAVQQGEKLVSAPDVKIGLEELRYLRILYYDFDAVVKEGEIVCNKLIADDLLYIFRELFHAEYQLESVRLIDDFDASDEASMAADNTSCFNYRRATGMKSLSKHAMGMAIDINPFYNPYVRDGRPVQPAGAEKYADRSADFPHKLDRQDLCCRLFRERGFSWGGAWTRLKDYQHFEK